MTSPFTSHHSVFSGIEKMPDAIAEKLHPLSPCDSGNETACSGPSEACEKAHELQEKDNAQNNLLYRNYWNALSFALGELGWTPMSILDVGCGDGTLLSWMARENRWAKLHAVDFSKDMVEIAQAKHPCRVQYKTISQEYNLPYPDNSMDVVVSHNVLSTHGDPHRLIQDMARIAKDTLIISTLHPAFLPLVKHYPITRFWHLNHREKNFYIHPQSGILEQLKGSAIKDSLEYCGFTVELVSSPWPFQLYLARHPQRQKQSFPDLVQQTGSACSLRPLEDASTR